MYCLSIEQINRISPYKVEIASEIFNSLSLNIFLFFPLDELYLPTYDKVKC